MIFPKFDVLSFNYTLNLYYNKLVIHQTSLNANIKSNLNGGLQAWSNSTEGGLL
jgi:hypothetical protein